MGSQPGIHRKLGLSSPGTVHGTVLGHLLSNCAHLWPFGPLAAQSEIPLHIVLELFQILSLEAQAPAPNPETPRIKSPCLHEHLQSWHGLLPASRSRVQQRLLRKTGSDERFTFIVFFVVCVCVCVFGVACYRIQFSSLSCGILQGSLRDPSCSGGIAPLN